MTLKPPRLISLHFQKTCLLGYLSRGELDEERRERDLFAEFRIRLN